MKSDNQGVKEETFIQTGRRGEERKPEWGGCATVWRLEDWAVSYSYVDKTVRRLGCGGGSETNCAAQGSSAVK